MLKQNIYQNTAGLLSEEKLTEAALLPLNSIELV